VKTCFILNPISGRNRRRPGLGAAIRDFIRARSLDAEFAVTDAPGHATALARTAVENGHELIVAVGGDGTMNEVAQGLLRTPAVLALVPCGSGNGLARHLGLPGSLPAALGLIAGTGARVAAIDTGTANGRPFFNAMGIGLDADVSRRFNALTSRGLPAYARTAAAALREIRPEHVHLTASGSTEALEILLLAVLNSDQYGNNARIAPGARVDDGQLDLVAVAPVSLAGAAVLAARLFLGALDQSPHVRRLRGRRFVIERTAPGLLHTDGEVHATGARIEIIAQPRSLSVLVPMSSRVLAAATARAPVGFALQFP